MIFVADSPESRRTTARVFGRPAGPQAEIPRSRGHGGPKKACFSTK